MVTVRTDDSGIQITWTGAQTRTTKLFVARFIGAQLRDMRDVELSSEASFAYVVLQRPPRSDDEDLTVGSTTPVAEFGFGSAPACPETWPLVELKALLQSVAKASAAADR